MTNIQIHDPNRRQKTTGQSDEKTLKLKKTVELIEENTREKKNKKNTIK